MSRKDPFHDLTAWKVKSIDGRPLSAYPVPEGAQTEPLSYWDASAAASRMIEKIDWSPWYSAEAIQKGIKIKYKLEFELEIERSHRTDHANQVRAPEIREVLHRLLLKQHRGENAILIDEMGLCAGAVIADVVVVGDRTFHAYEIKGETDSFKRFDKQQEIYSQVFTQASLVVAEGHLEEAYAKAPPWWGIYVVSRWYDGVIYDDRLLMRMSRMAQSNPRVDPKALVKFLWRGESLAVLRSLGLKIRHGRRQYLWDSIVQEVAPLELQQIVCRAIQKRAKTKPSDKGRWSLETNSGITVVDEVEVDVRPLAYVETP